MDRCTTFIVTSCQQPPEADIRLHSPLTVREVVVQPPPPFEINLPRIICKILCEVCVGTAGVRWGGERPWDRPLFTSTTTSDCGDDWRSFLSPRLLLAYIVLHCSCTGQGLCGENTRWTKPYFEGYLSTPLPLWCTRAVKQANSTRTSMHICSHMKFNEGREQCSSSMVN